MSKFCMLDCCLLQSKEVRSVDNDVWVSINSNDKVIYSYMKSRYDYHSANAREFYDSLDSIAESCGVSRSTIKVCISKLVAVGLIIKNKKKASSGFEKNVYTVVGLEQVFMR